jgi:hypothetical protein
MPPFLSVLLGESMLPAHAEIVASMGPRSTFACDLDKP